MPSKKPINIEDQIVTDSNGKRRFHGAFTGGFSAGFWNTVGSLEGWRPTEFKSTRTEKADSKRQRPEDFMDDEDLGEFGFAPQRIQTTDEFTVAPSTSSEKQPSNKRKFEKPSDGPIPGIPVLQQLLRAPRENVAIRILKLVGWKEGQGIGARQTRCEKKEARHRNKKEMYLMEKYGCEIAGTSKTDEHSNDEDSESDVSDTEITFAPDDYTEFLTGVKDNLFGLGYSGLNRNPVLKNAKHINLFSNFEVVGRDNKKFSISGQAFGVGALEEDDDDIYARDDLTKYDFSLDDHGKRRQKTIEGVQDKNVVQGFGISTNRFVADKEIFAVTVPDGFRPRNWSSRRTRFEPLEEGRAKDLRGRDEYRRKGLGRHDLKPDDRGRILNEKPAETVEKPKKPSVWDLINSKSFTKGEILNEDINEEHERVKREALKLTENLETSSGIFKPFIIDPGKQERYEKFLDFNGGGSIEDFLKGIQPLHFNEFEREMEKGEFVQAKKMYKPLRGMMSDRFVTEADVVRQEIVEKTLAPSKPEVTMKRVKCMWKPHGTLCKRFNVPDPSGGAPDEPRRGAKKRSNFSVFDYLENNLNDKRDFVTPVIVPHKERPLTTSNTTEQKEEKLENSRINTKELFQKEVQKEMARVASPDVIAVPSTSREISARVTLQTSKPKPREDGPKTDLERKIEETRFVHPSEKKDLFKAIFESSDEEGDDQTEPTKDILVKAAHQANSVDTILHKSASEINILRNNSPPRGIFANLFTRKSEAPKEKPSEPIENVIEIKDIPEAMEISIKITPQPKTPVIKFRSKQERLEAAEDIDVGAEDDALVFGPKPPPNLYQPIAAPSSLAMASTSVKTSSESKLDIRLEKLLRKNSELEEKWIEKDKLKKKKKKSKDHKSDKKHKKKHKRDRK